MTILNMPQLGLIALFCLFLTHLTAQREETILLNTQEIDEDRYEDVRGYPFIWEDWKAGIVVNNKGESAEVEKINFNAHTQTFEVTKGVRFIELSTEDQQEVVITTTEGPLTFRKNLHPDLPLEFNQLLYEGASLQLVKSTEKEISTKVFQNVGKKVTVQQFVKRETFYLIEKGKLRRIKISKKALLKALEQSKKVDSYIKKNKLKLKNDSDLIKLFAYYESIIE